MNYRKLSLIIVGIVLGVLVLAVIFISIYPKHHWTSAILDNISYGMTPREIESVFGPPIGKQTFDSDGGATLRYDYQVEIDGEMAQVTFSFVSVALHRELYRVHISFDEISTVEAANRIACTMKDQIWSAYSGNGGSYHKENGTTYQLGFVQGACGVDCEISIADNQVSVDCQSFY